MLLLDGGVDTDDVVVAAADDAPPSLQRALAYQRIRP